LHRIPNTRLHVCPGHQFQLIPQKYLMDIAIFLGLKSDTSKISLQVNLICFLLRLVFTSDGVVV